MKTFSPLLGTVRSTLFLTPAAAGFVVVLLCAATLRADQIEMQNGDRYVGKVMSLTPETLVLQSDVLGKVTLPRAKVSNITLGSAAPPAPVKGTTPAPAPTTPPAAAAKMPATSAVSVAITNNDLASALRSVGDKTNFIGEIQGQILSQAGPEANKKFNEMVTSLMNGTMDLKALRAEAKQAADQLREMKRDLPPEARESLDMYQDILDDFLEETKDATARPAPKPAPATGAVKSQP